MIIILNAINSTATLFADGTCLNIFAVNSLALEVGINQELEKMYKWTIANHITINPPKILLCNKTS